MGFGQNATAHEIDVTFYTTISLTLLAPVVLFLIASIWRRSMKTNINFGIRRQTYDIHVLRRPEARTTLARAGSLCCYRHRPLPIEALRLILQVAILLLLLEQIGLLTLLPIWCICDLSEGLHLLSLLYLGHTRSSRAAVRMATFFGLTYSLLFGFPLGFVAKLMWIVWRGQDIHFSSALVPMYIAGVGGFVFTLCYLMPNVCWSGASHGCQKAMSRFKIVLFMFCYCSMWMLLYYNMNLCNAAFLDNVKVTKFTFRCLSYFKSMTTALLPISIILIATVIILVGSVLEKGLLYRFLPELTIVWSGTITVITSLYVNDSRTFFFNIIPILCVSISIFATITVNIILILDILYGLRAPVIQMTDVNVEDTMAISEEELKRRQEVRLTNLKDFAMQHGKATLKGTLLMHIRKRDRMKQCCVCFDDFGKCPDSKDTEDGEKEKKGEDGRAPAHLLGIIKKCGHYFHFNCVWDWIQMHNTCPLCRIDIEVDKEAIKTVNYDQVRYALERSGTLNANKISTISKIVETKKDKKNNRKAVNEDIYSQSRANNTIEESDPDNPEEPSTIREPVRGKETIRGNKKNNERKKQGPPQRHSSKYCDLCRNKFLADKRSRDIVVGYIPYCGHFFHWDCIDKFVLANGHCPTCKLKVQLPRERRREGHGIDNGGYHTDEPYNDPRSEYGRSRDNRHPPRDNHPDRASDRRDEKVYDRYRPRDHDHRDSHQQKNSNRSDPYDVLPGPSNSWQTEEEIYNISQKHLYRPGSQDAPPRHYKRHQQSHGASHRGRDGPVNIRSNEIVFAFLSDIQRDMQGRNTVRNPRPRSDVH